MLDTYDHIDSFPEVVLLYGEENGRYISLQNVEYAVSTAVLVRTPLLAPIPYR